jgi:hypothetical protein
MKSPFPGMDPYLEQYWGDMHAMMTVYAREQLRRQVPPDLRVRIEEYLTIAFDGRGEIRRVRPDVRVVEKRRRARSGATTGRTATLSKPVIVELRSDPRKLRRIVVLDAASRNRVVTAIEFLSEANKYGEGAIQFRTKQAELLAGGTSVVEIDLIRSGGHVLTAPLPVIPPECSWPYRICVVKAWDRKHCELYPAGYRQPLPTVRVPLRKTDRPVGLDLQALIDRCYDEGVYGIDIDYAKAAVPPLEDSDARWADELLRAAGKR